MSKNNVNVEEEDDELELDEFIRDKCNSIQTINSLNLLPLTPDLPNCYMYTVIYSLSNLNKFVNYLIHSNKGQFSYLFGQISDDERLKHDDLVYDKRKFLNFWLNECFKYLLNLHVIPEHISDFNRRFLENYNIYDLFDCLREYCPMAEEDASLFLEFLFDNLSEVYKGTAHSESVDSLFKTRFINSYKCKTCSNVTKGPDDVVTIWRTSTENVDDTGNLINSFFKTQQLKPFSCENCKNKSEAEILTSTGGKVPLCLIIQIGRMNYNNNGAYKSEKYLNFEENLSIQNIEYDLKSIILHLGDGLMDGHYLVAIKKRIKIKPNDLQQNDLWFILDGNKYECMFDINNDFIHRNAILLFYEQK